MSQLEEISLPVCGTKSLCTRLVRAPLHVVTRRWKFRAQTLPSWTKNIQCESKGFDPPLASERAF
jgi:hypothetical protein